jgi:hypothetical protein
MSDTAGRLDNSGAAYKGSQLQTQLWVNRRPEQLAEVLAGPFPELAAADIDWRSPCAAENYREYQDAAFLKAVGLAGYAEQLVGNFWPRGGPVWDGLAVANLKGERGVILVEGKSYVGELFGGGCQATPTSQERIDAALARTQRWLHLEPDPARWCGRLYQSANRLAHLYWLREVVGVRAWLVHLLFVADPHGPTTADDWKQAMTAADTELGLTKPVDGAGHVMLQAGTREELVDGLAGGKAGPG